VVLHFLPNSSHGFLQDTTDFSRVEFQLRPNSSAAN
jgi:hypothetical protein